MTDVLPPNIIGALMYLAQKANGYGNRLQKDEVSKLKADLMNNKRRWHGFTPRAVRDTARELGMRLEDAKLVAELVGRAQAGRHLRAQSLYFRFSWDHDALARLGTDDEQYHD